MYNLKDIQFVGKHDFDNESALRMSWQGWNETFSIGIFKWEMKNNDKEMKKGKTIVRVLGDCNNRDQVFNMAEQVVKSLDLGDWDGRKTVNVR